jgi:hypothetical protein
MRSSTKVRLTHLEVVKLVRSKKSKWVNRFWKIFGFRYFLEGLFNLLLGVDELVIVCICVQFLLNDIQVAVGPLTHSHKPYEELVEPRAALRRARTVRGAGCCYSRRWRRRSSGLKLVGRQGQLRLDVTVLHILHKGNPGHVLNEGHDEGSISTCLIWCDRHIPNLLKNVIKYVEWLLLLDCIYQVPLIGRNGGGITNPKG